MNTVNSDLLSLEKQVEQNQRLLRLCTIMVLIVAAATANIYFDLVHLPFRNKLSLTSSKGNQVVLTPTRINFMDAKGNPVVKIDTEDVASPSLEFFSPDNSSSLRTTANGGCKLIMVTTNTDSRAISRLTLQVGPHAESGLFMENVGKGSLKLGLSTNGEPELILQRTSGGKMELRVPTNGQPFISEFNRNGELISDRK